MLWVVTVRLALAWYVGVKCLNLDWLAWICLAMPTSPCWWPSCRNPSPVCRYVSWLVGSSPVCCNGAVSSLWLLLLRPVCLPRQGRCLWLLRTKPASVCYALLSYMSPQTFQHSWQSDRLCSRGCSPWCEAIQKLQLHLLLAVTYESVLHRSVVFWERLILFLR